MKTKISVLFLTLFVMSCQYENVLQSFEDQNEQTIETFYSEELQDIPCGLQNIDHDEEEVNLVIKDQADLEKYFQCHDELPEIDFGKYFLLAGVYRHNQCAVFDSQSVTLSNNRVIYKINVIEQDCFAFTSVLYLTTIERKYLNLPVEFEIRFKN
ncbi:hypothetical protein [Peijinzhouia sedimentorum]